MGETIKCLDVHIIYYFFGSDLRGEFSIYSKKIQLHFIQINVNALHFIFGDT
jgi:hypothetical protein